jgi:hypothetical protein
MPLRPASDGALPTRVAAVRCDVSVPVHAQQGAKVCPVGDAQPVQLWGHVPDQAPGGDALPAPAEAPEAREGGEEGRGWGPGSGVALVRASLISWQPGRPPLEWGTLSGGCDETCRRPGTASRRRTRQRSLPAPALPGPGIPASFRAWARPAVSEAVRAESGRIDGCSRALTRCLAPPADRWRIEQQFAAICIENVLTTYYKTPAAAS